MITFYQSFVFSILQDYGVMSVKFVDRSGALSDAFLHPHSKETAYWTAENVADGLQALCTCCEVRCLSHSRRGAR